MMFTKINLESWNRAEHFHHYMKAFLLAFKLNTSQRNAIWKGTVASP